MAEISKEVITLAYNLFFGRDPESKEAIEYHKKAKNVQELGKTILNSSEFKAIIGIDYNKAKLCDRLYIEDKASPQKLNLMISKIKEVWSDYGQDEPYWSVLAEDKYYKYSFSNHQEEFYKTGLGSQKLLTNSLNRNGISIKNLSTCLEFGCGIGRVTGHLAKLFKSVIACDISNSHLKLAEKYAESMGINNILFRNTFSPKDILELQDVDVVFSIIVLQHNPPPLIAEYIRVLLAILNSGGVAFLQVTTYQKGYKFSLNNYIKNIGKNKGLEMHIIPQHSIFEIVREKNCIVREVREDDWPGDSDYISNSFLIQKL